MSKHNVAAPRTAASDSERGPQYEPPAEMVEALANELHEVGGAAYGIDRVPLNAASDSWERMMRSEARFILRRQHERERGLLETLRSIERVNYIVTPARVCSLALAAHAALDAPKVPTLLEAADALVRSANEKQSTFAAVDISAYQALKAAVEREEKNG